MNCIHYAGNQYCNLYKSKVASVYCGDICEDKKGEPETEGCCYDSSDFPSVINPYE